MKKLQYIAKDEQGSALLTVLIIALIISLFIGAVFGGIYLQSKFIQRDINQTKALYKAEQQIYQYLHYGTNSDSLGELTSTNYGGYFLINSTSKVENQRAELEVLVGEFQDTVFNYAIALKDTNSALNLTGSTVVHGDVASGSNEVEKSSFKGFPFRGAFNGESKKRNMKDLFPTFEMEPLENQLLAFESMFDKNLNKFTKYGLSNVTNSKTGDTLYFDKTQIWELTDETVFPKKSVVIVNGNLTISGEGSLGVLSSFIVKDTLTLEGSITGAHVLMSAGEFVELTDWVTLSGQILTKGNALLSKEAYLTYPSVIYSSKETYLGEENEVIYLKDNSKIDGTIIYPIETGAFNQQQYRIKIDKGAVVRGSIYNVGQTELHGKIMGSVLTRQFYFYKSPTSYINWIKDAEIDISQRPEGYITPIGFSDSTRYTILSWEEI